MYITMSAVQVKGSQNKDPPFWQKPVGTGSVHYVRLGPVLQTDVNRVPRQEPRRYGYGWLCFTALQWIDLISGMISVLALFISIDGVANWFGWNIQSDLQWPMWHENILCYNSSPTLQNETTETCINDTDSFDLAFGDDSTVGMQYAYNTTNAGLQNYCKNNQDYMLPDNLGRNWNQTHYQCQVITSKHGGFYVWWALRLVFVISAIFQLARVYFSLKKDNRYSPVRPKYFACKPDFWRWWEYALTSPIQIFIIGLSFFMGSQSELIALAGLQAALCFMGFIVEKRIDKLYKAKIKSLHPKAGQSVKEKDSILKIIKILIVLSAAWAFFVIIWDYVLWPRFNRQANNPENCHYGSKMPKEVRFIVWAEYILFLLFGLTQTMQVIIFFLDINYWPQNFTNINLMEHYWKHQQEKRWYQFTMVYSILSITAKTLLEFGLLQLSVQFSEMI
jgi:hypothetical protein